MCIIYEKLDVQLNDCYRNTDHLVIFLSRRHPSFRITIPTPPLFVFQAFSESNLERRIS